VLKNCCQATEVAFPHKPMPRIERIPKVAGQRTSSKVVFRLRNTYPSKNKERKGMNPSHIQTRNTLIQESMNKPNQEITPNDNRNPNTWRSVDSRTIIRRNGVAKYNIRRGNKTRVGNTPGHQALPIIDASRATAPPSNGCVKMSKENKPHSSPIAVREFSKCAVDKTERSIVCRILKAARRH
jgi:hypothetical protein